MFLDHNYIGKVEHGSLKVELYETGKRTWLFKKIYAYQIFDNNRLVCQSENFVPGRKVRPFDEALVHAKICLPGVAPLALDYIECFEVVQ